MNISKRDQKLLLILLGLAIFLVSYLFVSTAFNNKADAVQAEIDTLSPRLEELRGYYANLAQYQQEVDKIEQSVNDTLAKYPADVRSEDIVMYAVELSDKIGISVENISIDTPEVFSQFSIPEKTNEGYEIVPMAALRVRFVLNCGLNYEQLKSLMNYVYNNSQRTALDSVSVSYNTETGKLLGSVTLNKYFVVASDYIYKATSIPPVEKGVLDPFGTFPTEAAPDTTTITDTP